MTPEQIFNSARAKAAAAAAVHDATLPPEQKRGLECGFAWVNISPARGAFIKYLKENKIGRRDEYAGGWTIWYSALHDVNTQSISTHEAAANAFRNEIAPMIPEYKVYVSSRLD